MKMKLLSALKNFRLWVILSREGRFDLKCYFRAVRKNGEVWRPVSHLEGDLIRHYHVIEKGLTMTDFRPRFGQNIVLNLLNLLREADEHPERDMIDTGQWSAAKDILHQYVQRHIQMGIDVSDLIPELWPLSSEDEGGSGIRPLSRIEQSAIEGFREMVSARHSVRNFDMNKTVKEDQIKEACRIALTAPSVCNRQTSRVHCFTGEEAQNLLALQNGNRGFGHTIPCLLIVTTDLRYFIGVEERYQSWIDGGMFSMLLLLGLQSEGLGAVSLNWSVCHAKDDEFHRKSGIPEWERVMMFIGCGYPSYDCSVTSSKRKIPDSILTFYE